MTAPVVFLDFDGVLNSLPFLNRQRETVGLDDDRHMFDPACVVRLNEILARTGADIVLSTSWREFRTMDELRALLNAVGVIGTVVDKTPISFSHLPRWAEINRWLGMNEFDGRFMVLDDSVEPDEPDLSGFVVQTSMATGLTAADVEAACRILGEYKPAMDAAPAAA